MKQGTESFLWEKDELRMPVVPGGPLLSPLKSLVCMELAVFSKLQACFVHRPLT